MRVNHPYQDVQCSPYRNHYARAKLRLPIWPKITLAMCYLSCFLLSALIATTLRGLDVICMRTAVGRSPFIEGQWQTYWAGTCRLYCKSSFLWL